MASRTYAYFFRVQNSFWILRFSKSTPIVRTINLTSNRFGKPPSSRSTLRCYGKPAVTSWSLMSLCAAAVAKRPAHVFQTEKSRQLWAGSGSYSAEISTETRPPLRILDTRTPLCCFQAGGEDTSFPARRIRKYDVRSILHR